MDLAKKIDHTILKSDATEQDVLKYCDEAKKYGFASVCVNPCNVKFVSDSLQGSSVLTCSVIGFPFGAHKTEVKAFEAENALKDGAHEIDMVINVGALKQKRYDFVTNDIAAVKKVCKNSVLKVILETCLLTKEEIIVACNCALDAGADFVKTSTGFSTGGATIEDIVLMKKTVGIRAKIKASGGIRTHKDALAMIEAGADRIGAGNGVILLK